MSAPFRFEPKGPARLYETYAIRSPLLTHFVSVLCDDPESGCQGWTNGWSFQVEKLDAKMLHFVTHAGKRFRRVELGPGETHLVFEPGQYCFHWNTHKKKLDRAEFFYVGNGDHRTFSTRRAIKMKPDDWQDKMANHLDAIRTEVERG